MRNILLRPTIIKQFAVFHNGDVFIVKNNEFRYQQNINPPL